MLSRHQKLHHRVTYSQTIAAAMEDKRTWGSGGLFGDHGWRILGSIALLVLTPIFVLTFWYTCEKRNGSFVDLYAGFRDNGFYNELTELWPTPFDPLAWKIILSYMAFELFLMKFVPGKKFESTLTPTGHLPTYNANGVQCYVISIATLALLAYFDLFNPSIVYDNMGKLLSSMNLFALCFCAMLTWKGLYRPSTQDCGSNGNLVFDFFWGTELYPRILGWDVKMFTNCRFGMMFWQLGLLCYACKQYEIYGSVSSSMLVSVLLQTSKKQT